MLKSSKLILRSLLVTLCLYLIFPIFGCSRPFKSADVILDESRMNSDSSVSLSHGPLVAAVGVAFQDTSIQGGILAGEVNISRASDESGILEYRIYWASGPRSKLPYIQPIAKLSKASPALSFTLPEGTMKPSTATHFLILTANSVGEMSRGVSVLIKDLGVPNNAAVSAAFTDFNLSGGKLTGSISISRAADEADVSHYVIYWAKEDGTKIFGSPIATFEKSVALLSKDLQDIDKPEEAKYFLILSKNIEGEMATGVLVPIIDLGVPVNSAIALRFNDKNFAGGKLSGEIEVSKASNEEDITHYVLYFGLNKDTKQSTTPITSLQKTGQNLTYNLPPETAKPDDATHLLVFTKNPQGEMSTGVALPIIDKGIPEHSALSVSFTDVDLAGGALSGDIEIAKASDEADISHYVVYFGLNSFTKQGQSPIVSLPKTGRNLKYNLPAGTIKPAEATHFLVFTKNADGEMSGGVSVEIVGRGVPVNPAVSVSFSDTDLLGGKISGAIEISKASDESDFSHYVVYFGSSDSTKQSQHPIVSLEKTGQNLTHILPAGTNKPADATHLLVFTKNADGEMAAGVAAEIIDKGPPINAAVSVAFADTNLNGGKLSGVIEISKATDESDITHYIVYFGLSASSKQSQSPIVSLRKSGKDLKHTLTAGTIKPADAMYLLVFTKNAGGEMAHGVAVPIVDSIASEVSSGRLHTCVLMSDKTVKCWGLNERGQLGDGTFIDKVSPTNISGLNNVNSISSGGYHTCALLADGTVKCWGSNERGQLGDGTTVDKNTPTSVSGLTSVISISTGVSHTCALLRNNTVKCWGLNSSGQLGDGTKVNRSAPTTVTGLGTVTSISLGAEHTCALMEFETVYCWGLNYRGQLGDGTNINKLTPTSVPYLASVRAITVGSEHSCALMVDKTIKCWGSNSHGQLGDSTTTFYYNPPSVPQYLYKHPVGISNWLTPNILPSLSAVRSISSGVFHTCAVLEDLSVKCWGSNGAGQLGFVGIETSTPTSVPGLSSVWSVSSGYHHTCALVELGGVKCWGSNWNGQLGDGTTAKR